MGKPLCTLQGGCRAEGHGREAEAEKKGLSSSSQLTALMEGLPWAGWGHCGAGLVLSHHACNTLPHSGSKAGRALQRRDLQVQSRQAFKSTLEEAEVGHGMACARHCMEWNPSALSSFLTPLHMHTPPSMAFFLLPASPLWNTGNLFIQATTGRPQTLHALCHASPSTRGL